MYCYKLIAMIVWHNEKSTATFLFAVWNRVAVISKTLFGDCCQIGGAVTRRNIYFAGNVSYSLTLYLRKLKLEDTYVDTPTLV